MATRLAGRVGWLKVGLEAFVAEGPGLVAEVAKASGARVFLDLKFHDIPATVAGAVASAARSGAAMVNVHASGRPRDARGGARGRAARGPREAHRRHACSRRSTRRRSRICRWRGSPRPSRGALPCWRRECGLDGVVCSAADLPGIRAACGPDFFTVVPGIRPAGADVGRSEARRDARRGDRGGGGSSRRRPARHGRPRPGRRARGDPRRGRVGFRRIGRGIMPPR